MPWIPFSWNRSGPFSWTGFSAFISALVEFTNSKCLRYENRCLKENLCNRGSRILRGSQFLMFPQAYDVRNCSGHRLSPSCKLNTGQQVHPISDAVLWICWQLLPSFGMNLTERQGAFLMRVYIRIANRKCLSVDLAHRTELQSLLN